MHFTPFIAYALPQGPFKYGQLQKSDTGFQLQLSSFDARTLLNFSLSEIFETRFRTLLAGYKFALQSPPVSDITIYRKALQRGLEALDQGSMLKVVLTRAIRKEHRTDIISIFNKLMSLPDNTFRYMLCLEGECWVGASPETLLHCSGHRVTAHALAGTLPAQSGDWTDKERLEQQLVADTIVASFMQAGISDVAMTPVTEKKAGFVRHLFSEISGTVSSAEVLDEVIRNLHPTPAVCGLPRRRAAEFIRKNEGFDRSYYTGYIGLRFPGEMHYFVNLRCMRLMGIYADVFVGGGLVKGSTPDNEERETILKARLMLSLLNDEYE